MSTRPMTLQRCPTCFPFVLSETMQGLAFRAPIILWSRTEGPSRAARLWWMLRLATNASFRRWAPIVGAAGHRTGRVLSRPGAVGWPTGTRFDAKVCVDKVATRDRCSRSCARKDTSEAQPYDRRRASRVSRVPLEARKNCRSGGSRLFLASFRVVLNEDGTMRSPAEVSAAFGRRHRCDGHGPLIGSCGRAYV